MEISDRCGAFIWEDLKDFHQYHSIRELLKITSKTISLVADFQHSSLTNTLSLSNPLQWTIPSFCEWSGLLGPLLALTIVKVRGYWHGWTQLIQKCKFIQGNVLSLLGGLPCFTKIFKVIPPNTQCLLKVIIHKPMFSIQFLKLFVT